ncbi:MAG: aminoacyl-tRNA hydrolase [Candidatus Zambryskibacteria bacterium]|nr:aminoacyl-tRNA hydrolase [Candidatus Zambryskibacteria bacterium]
MLYIIVGLGNPGEEYEGTRHNTGRMLLEWFGKSIGAEWKADKKLNAQVSKVKVGKSPVTLILPDTFMNKSGNSIKQLVTSSKAPASAKAMAGKTEKTIVIYDDLDLPFGSARISFNKSSGGHKGLESIIKAVKTEKFARIRVGISPTSPTGKIRKPQGEEKVMKHILGEFKPDEISVLKKLSKKVNLAIETFVTSGLERAMTGFD